MAYFCRLYISSEALALVLTLCDLFGLKSLLSLPSGECKCACVHAFSIEVFHHLNAPCSFVIHVSHRCFSGSLDTWEIIMNQGKEPGLFLISSRLQKVEDFIKAVLGFETLGNIKVSLVWSIFIIIFLLLLLF